MTVKTSATTDKYLPIVANARIIFDNLHGFATIRGIMSSESINRQTPLSVAVLRQLLEAKGWSQYELEKHSGVHRSTISMHLGLPPRPIRDLHLSGYMRALQPGERRVLMAAWLRDTLGGDIIDEIVDRDVNRVREEVLEWTPKLTEADQKMLNWLAHEVLTDAETRNVISSICRKLGFNAS